MAVKPIICPVCGSTKTTGYFYGKQEQYYEALKVMTKNPPLYGGNTMTPDTPMYHCKDCGHDWNIPHKYPFSGEADKDAKRLRCVVDDMMSITKGKIYEVKSIKNGAYGIIDDEEEGVYLYNPACFEVVDDDFVVEYEPPKSILFRGKIKSLSLMTEPCYFVKPPEFGYELEQKLTITKKGYVKVYRKISEGWDSEKEPQTVTEKMKISIEDTEKIFNRIGRYFTKEHEECIVCDEGTWELRLTNTEGEVFRYFGSTCCSDHRSALSRVSKLIRKITGLEYILGFDEDTQYGFLLLNKIDNDPADVIEKVKKVAHNNELDVFNVVEYIGEFEGARVYSPIFKEVLEIGMPPFILVKNGKAWLEISEYGLKIIDALCKDDN